MGCSQIMVGDKVRLISNGSLADVKYIYDVIGKGRLYELWFSGSGCYRFFENEIEKYFQ